MSGTITVSATASLQGAFTNITAAFEKANPNASITINFAASSTLASQIMSGAPIDVFASADEANMAKVSEANLIVGTATNFASNSLEIIVRKGNPSKITSLADLTKPGLIYITCGPEVPIGRYSAQVLKNANVTVKPASFEPDVKGIVAKVSAGEADAGIVYTTDVAATNGATVGIVIPASVNVIAKYPIATISTSKNQSLAQAWIDFVLSAEGRSILQSYGFGAL